MTPTWRVSRPGSSSVIRLTTSAGLRPCSSSEIAFGPYDRFADACVATAPTPGFAYGTAAPAPNARDCTPTPSSFVAGSNAMIENVPNHGSGGAGESADWGAWAPSDTALRASNRTSGLMTDDSKRAPPPTDQEPLTELRSRLYIALPRLRRGGHLQWPPEEPASIGTPQAIEDVRILLRQQSRAGGDSPLYGLFWANPQSPDQGKLR